MDKTSLYSLFKTREVRDLVWAIYSPSLIDDSAELVNGILPCFKFNFEKDQPVLKELDANPELLITYLESNFSSRLGKYFENLVAFYFDYYPDYELLAKGLQVQGEKGTVGEFDLIVKKLETGEIFHIETAVKFYLQYSEAQADNDWSYWIGPACKDRFDIKLAKLLNKQCCLSDHIDSQKVLAPITDGQMMKRCLHLKGALFNYENGPRRHFQYENDLLRTGIWLHQQDIDLFTKNNPAAEFAVLNRLQWLTGALNESNYSPIGKLNKIVNDHMTTPGLEKQPVMISLSSGEQPEIPFDRIFIVPDSWPYL